MRSRLAVGMAWITVSRAALNLIGLVSTIVLARLLAPADFGIVALASSLIAVAASLTELSLTSALMHHRTLVEDHFHSAWTASLLRSAALALVYCASAYPLAQIYHEPRLIAVMVVVGLTTAAGGLTNPKVAMLARELVFWQEFVLTVAQSLAGFIVGVTLALLLRSYWALIWSGVASVLAGIVVSYAIRPYSPRFRLTHFRELFKFSGWLSLAQLVNTLNWRFDSLVIGYFLGKAPLGIYSMGDGVSALPTRELSTPIAATLFPGFVKLADQPHRLRSAYQLAQSTLCAIALPAGFGFAVIAQPLITLVLGPKWALTIPMIQVLAGTFAFQTLSTSMQPLAMAKGATRLLFGRDVRTFAIRIPFIIVGMIFGGFMGIVYARSASSFIGTIWNMGLVKTLSGISIWDQFRANARSLVGVTAMVAVTLSLELVTTASAAPLEAAWRLALLVGAGAATYLGAVFGLWLLAGRPVGPENEAIQLLGKVRSLLSPPKLAL